jgi:AraC-like DNA-binding protein
VVTSVSNFRLVPGERTSLLEVIPGLPTRRGLQLTNELALAAAMALSREVGRGSLEPVAVHLSLPAPDDPASFERHFGRSIGYEAGRDALEVADVDLSRPNRLGDDSISRFFDAHLDDAIAELPDGGALLRRVKSEISKVLSEGPPTVAETARRLAMSRRTLQRKLAEEGVGYRDLVAEVQHSLAKKLLRSSDCMLAEVAFLTGFADQSSFGRAFKRREGRTPGSFRRGALP